MPCEEPPILRRDSFSRASRTTPLLLLLIDFRLILLLPEPVPTVTVVPPAASLPLSLFLITSSLSLQEEDCTLCKLDAVPLDRFVETLVLLEEADGLAAVDDN